MRTRALIVALAGLVLAGLVVADASAIERALLEGLRLIPAVRPTPPLALKRLSDGKTVSLADLRGRPVLLYFWATW